MFVCLSVSYQNPEFPECVRAFVRSFVRAFSLLVCLFVRSFLCRSPLHFTRLSEARLKVSIVSQPTAGAKIKGTEGTEIIVVISLVEWV